MNSNNKPASARNMTRRAKRKNLTETEGHGSALHDRWLISFADLMTLLFSLFVVLYAAADKDRAHAVAEALAAQINSGPIKTQSQASGGNGVLPGSDSVLDEARAAVERTRNFNERLRSSTRVTQTAGGFVISLAEAGFFPPGEAAMRDDARALLNELTTTLNGTQTAIRVEGHTDAIPIATARYPSNWELSSARASAVLAQLVAHGIAPGRLSVAGYASEKPIADNSTPEGRALNRRVDLVVLQNNK